MKVVKKKKKVDPNEVPFSVHERRTLELPIGVPQLGAEARALRKIIDTFPWMLDVADCKFDPKVKDAVIYAHGMRIQADRLEDAAREEYFNRERK